MQTARYRRRRENLERLIREAGSAQALARLAGANASYLSQLRHQMPNVNGRPRAVGNIMAARLEKAMRKPEGWMDEPQGGEAGTMESLACRSKGPIPCPLISWAQAVNWTETERSATRDAPAFLHCPVRCSPGTFVLQVQGSSMEPEFEAGDWIFVDPQVPPDSGRFVVVTTADSDEAVFRKIVVEGGRRYLEAVNLDWPDRISEAGADAAICGVAVFKGRPV